MGYFEPKALEKQQMQVGHPSLHFSSWKGDTNTQVTGSLPIPKRKGRCHQEGEVEGFPPKASMLRTCHTGVPLVAQWKQIRLVSMRRQVRSLASLSGLGSRIAVAVAGSCSSDLTPSLGTSVCHGCSNKREKTMRIWDEDIPYKKPCWNNSYLYLASPHSWVAFPQLPFFVQRNRKACGFHCVMHSICKFACFSPANLWYVSSILKPSWKQH